MINWYSSASSAIEGVKVQISKDRRLGKRVEKLGCFQSRVKRRLLFPIPIKCYVEGRKMSPTVFKEKGYRFFFFSREETRMHVHISSHEGEAKYWLEPQIEMAKNIKLSRQHLKQIESLIEEHYDELISAWHEHFGS